MKCFNRNINLALDLIKFYNIQFTKIYCSYLQKSKVLTIYFFTFYISVIFKSI